MKFSHLDSEVEFLRECEKICRDSELSLRDAALVNPKRFMDWEGSWRLPRSLDELIALSIWSWYWDNDLAVVLRYEIEEKVKNNTDLWTVRFFLQTKELMLSYLLQTSNWTTRSFFGSILNFQMLQRLSKIVRPRWKSRRKPTRTIRRRGYKDKGTLRKDSHPNKFIDTSKEHMLLEEKRRELDDTFYLALSLLE